MPDSTLTPSPAAATQSAAARGHRLAHWAIRERGGLSDEVWEGLMARVFTRDIAAAESAARAEEREACNQVVVLSAELLRAYAKMSPRPLDHEYVADALDLVAEAIRARATPAQSAGVLSPERGT